MTSNGNPTLAYLLLCPSLTLLRASLHLIPPAFCIVVGFALPIPYAAAGVLAPNYTRFCIVVGLALPIPYAAAGVLAPNSTRFLHRSGIGFAHPLRCRGRPCTIKQKKMRSSKLGASFFVLWCGKSGIQTHGTLKAYAGFRVRSIRSLWHLSAAKVINSIISAKREGIFFRYLG